MLNETNVKDEISTPSGLHHIIQVSRSTEEKNFILHILSKRS